MKKTTRISTSVYIALSLAFLFVYYGCSKERIQEEPKKQYQSVNTYLDTKKQEEQEFIIDTSGTGPIIGKLGTKIWMGKQCLMFPNGDSVTWPFSIKLVELYTAKDMIYYQMPTVSSGTILKTDGEIRLRAFKNGTELILKPSPCMAQIEMPCAAPQASIHVFNGTTTNSKPDWLENSPVNTFTTNPSSYTASISVLGWINCGLLAGGPANSSIMFKSSTDDLTNVGLFIYIPSTKTVMQVYNQLSGAIPNGTSVNIVAIAIDASGTLFSFLKNETINANALIDVTLSETTDANLTTLLDGL